MKKEKPGEVKVDFNFRFGIGSCACCGKGLFYEYCVSEDRAIQLLMIDVSEYPFISHQKIKFCSEKRKKP